jgi:CRP-like cAMP-binding protein
MSKIEVTGCGLDRAPHALFRTGWLSEQPEDFQRRILDLGRWRTYRVGEPLYEVGDEPNGVFGLEHGQLDLSMPISDNEMIVLHRAQPGFWAGDLALLSGTPRAVSLTAHVESLVMAIPAEPLLRHLADRPEDIAYFYRLTQRGFVMALKGLADVLGRPPRARFAQLLLRLSSADGKVQATQTELGEMAGMSRSAFRRAFGGLIDAGIVRTEYGVVRILDADALQEEADQP